MPIYRVIFAISNLEWLLRFKSDDCLMQALPLFRIGPDIQVHSRQSSPGANRVGTIEEYVRDRPRIVVRLDQFLGETMFLKHIPENLWYFVVVRAKGTSFLPLLVIKGFLRVSPKRRK